jgi:dTDP-4-dehydrorhamnose reductase
MKILVLGADGMLGHVVKLYFQENGYMVKGTSRRKSENDNYYYDVVANVGEIESIIDTYNPGVVINCIGLLNKIAEENQSLAVLLNSYLPHYVDELCKKRGIKFIHVSTDCVFDGTKGEYTENSIKDAKSFYGQSKALGEVNNDSSLTLRTSIVGPDTNEKGIGLFQWFMNQKAETSGYDKVIWTGVTTIELAKAMEKAIQNNLSGLRHVVNNEKIDKYSLLNLFKNHFKKDIIINKNSDVVSDKSVMRTTDFDFNIPSYDQMVKDMADWITNHENLYSENQRVKK